MFRPHPLLQPSTDAPLIIPDDSETNSRTTTRSRISSFASLLAEKDDAETENYHTEKFSLRQLAKSYASRGTHGRIGSKSIGVDDECAEESTSRTFRRRGRSRTPRETNKCNAAKEDNDGAKAPYKTPLRNAELPNAESKDHFEDDLFEATRQLMDANLEEQENLTMYVKGKAIDNSSKRSALDRYSQLVTPSNTVVLKDFPSKTMDLTSILAQVCGGPLQKISVEQYTDKASQDSWANYRLNLSFMKVEEAEKFMAYAHTGLFNINGCHIPATYGTEDSESDVQELSDTLKEMHLKGARRCLILKQNVKSTHGSLKNNPRSILLDFDPKKARQDFSKFGPIVDIAAIVSKRLSFAVHFYDTRSAIDARVELETAGTELSKKYTDWGIWYGKDPCDRPCYAI